MVFCKKKLAFLFKRIIKFVSYPKLLTCFFACQKFGVAYKLQAESKLRCCDYMDRSRH